MCVATKVGIRTVRFVNGTVDTVILALMMLLITLGIFVIWETNQIFNRADSTQYTIYKPTVENEALSFMELQALNPDVFAWLTVYGTNIDYPVVQGADNLDYVSRSARGEYSFSGAIFLDWQTSRDFADFTSIIYGHHMDRNAMFGDIGSFADEEYFKARRYGTLFFDGEEHGIEFFLFTHVDAYDPEIFRVKIEGQEQQQAYLDLLYSVAMHTRDIQVMTDDRLIMLVTCSIITTNGRDILVGRLTDNVAENTFNLEETGTGNIFTIDGLPELWAQTPLLAKIFIIALPFVIVALLVTLIIKKKRRA